MVFCSLSYLLRFSLVFFFCFFFLFFRVWVVALVMVGVWGFVVGVLFVGLFCCNCGVCFGVSCSLCVVDWCWVRFVFGVCCSI